MIAPFGYDPALLKQLGPTLAGTVIYITFVPFEVNSPAHQRIIDAMTRYAPQVQSPVQDSAVFGWLSADMFLRGLEAAGPCPTRPGFIQGLRGVRAYDGGGLLPAPIDLATNRGKAANCYDFVRVSDDGSRFLPLDPVVRCGLPISDTPVS
nr:MULTISPECIES: ABC transporter substrate-binding protein [Protofrankia]